MLHAALTFRCVNQTSRSWRMASKNEPHNTPHTPFPWIEGFVMMTMSVLHALINRRIGLKFQRCLSTCWSTTVSREILGHNRSRSLVFSTSNRLHVDIIDRVFNCIKSQNILWIPLKRSVISFPWKSWWTSAWLFLQTHPGSSVTSGRFSPFTDQSTVYPRGHQSLESLCRNP